MKKLKNASFKMLSVMLSLLAIVFGASSGVMMANAADLPDAGKTASGASVGDGAGNAGIATESGGRQDGDPEFYTKDIDQRIIKIRPMATPVDQISRHAKAQHSTDT